MNDKLTDFAKYGVVGIAIAAICFIVFQFTGLVANHIQHSTAVLQEVKDVVRENSAAIDRNTQVLQEVEETLLQLNGK